MNYTNLIKSELSLLEFQDANRLQRSRSQEHFSIWKIESLFYNELS